MIVRHVPGPIHHRVVEHDGTIYVGGLVAGDKSKDMKGQAEEIFAKLEDLLVQAGSSKKKLLSVTIFSAAFGERQGFNEAWTEWLAPEDFPVRAYIGGAELSEGTRVEITAIAAK
ncbi:RidA family protein [Kordiimonas sp.]|uniref:RidA family protein n=1 Tax=Kordiimonas sp. TaxID=1970157 RepID=UPI003A94D2F2